MLLLGFQRQCPRFTTIFWLKHAFEGRRGSPTPSSHRKDIRVISSVSAISIRPNAFSGNVRKMGASLDILHLLALTR